MMRDFYAKRDSQIIKYQQLMPDPFHFHNLTKMKENEH